MAYLTCNGLAIGYGGKPVASNIELSVGPGELLCIVGDNGAGKSTLVKTLLGLLPPLAGELSFGESCGPTEVGYLPQQGEVALDHPASVWEVVLSGRVARLGHSPFYRAADRTAAADAMRQTGVAALRSLPFAQLSGGQRQRVLLARALCAAAKLIILDEPTTGLDPSAAAALYDLLDTLRSQGLGIVTVSHDVGTALGHATHVLDMGTNPPRFTQAGSTQPKQEAHS